MIPSVSPRARHLTTPELTAAKWPAPIDAALALHPDVIEAIVSAAVARSGSRLTISSPSAHATELTALWRSPSVHTDFPAHRPFAWLTLRFARGRLTTFGVEDGAATSATHRFDLLEFTSRIGLTLSEPDAASRARAPARVQQALADGRAVRLLAFDVQGFGAAPTHRAASHIDGRPLDQDAVQALQHLLPNWLRGLDPGDLLWVVLDDDAASHGPTAVAMQVTADRGAGAVSLIFATDSRPLHPAAGAALGGHNLRPTEHASLVIARHVFARRVIEGGVLAALSRGIGGDSRFGWTGGTTWRLEERIDYRGRPFRAGRLRDATESGHMRHEVSAHLGGPRGRLRLTVRGHGHLDRHAHGADGGDLGSHGLSLRWSLTAEVSVRANGTLRVSRSPLSQELHDDHALDTHAEHGHEAAQKALARESHQWVQRLLRELRKVDLRVPLGEVGAAIDAWLASLIPASGAGLRLRDLGIDEHLNLVGWLDLHRTRDGGRSRE